MTLTVELNGLLMDEADVDGDGIVWCVEDVEGWHGSPNARVASTLIPVGGELVTAAQHGGRPLVLRGIAKRSTGGALADSHYWLASRKLGAAANIVTGAGLLKVTDDLALQAYVRRVDRIRYRRRGALQWYAFELALLAEDWRRFTQATTTNTDLQLTGSGTSDTATVTLPSAANGGAETPPVFTIDGPAINPKITNADDGGKFVLYAGTVTAGQTLVIDVGAGTVLLDGADAMDNLDPTTRWWSLQPGANDLTYARTSGTGTSTCQIDYREAYV